jgi:hypothetical protein
MNEEQYNKNRNELDSLVQSKIRSGEIDVLEGTKKMQAFDQQYKPRNVLQKVGNFASETVKDIVTPIDRALLNTGLTLGNTVRVIKGEETIDPKTYQVQSPLTGRVIKPITSFKDAAGVALETSSNIPFAKAVGGSVALGKGVIKNASKDTISDQVKKGLIKSLPTALEGALGNTLSGVGSDLSKDKSISEIIPEIKKYAVIGGAFGLGLGVAGQSFGRIISNISKKRGRNLTTKEIDELSNEFKETGTIKENPVDEIISGSTETNKVTELMEKANTLEKQYRKEGIVNRAKEIIDNKVQSNNAELEKFISDSKKSITGIDAKALSEKIKVESKISKLKEQLAVASEKFDSDNNTRNLKIQQLENQLQNETSIPKRVLLREKIAREKSNSANEFDTKIQSLITKNEEISKSLGTIDEIVARADNQKDIIRLNNIKKESDIQELNMNLAKEEVQRKVVSRLTKESELALKNGDIARLDKLVKLTADRIEEIENIRNKSNRIVAKSLAVKEADMLIPEGVTPGQIMIEENKGIIDMITMKVEKFNRIKLSQKKIEALFDARENGFPITDKKSKEANDIMTDVYRDVNNQLRDLDIADFDVLKDSTYIKTLLTDLNGNPLSSVQLAELSSKMNDMAGNKDLVAALSSMSIRDSLKQTKKYMTRAERDAVLAKYGYKTNTNLFEVFSSDINTKLSLIKREQSGVTLSLLGSDPRNHSKIKTVYTTEDIQDIRADVRAQVNAKLKDFRDDVRSLAGDSKDIKILTKEINDIYDIDNVDIENIPSVTYRELEKLINQTVDTSKISDERLEGLIDEKIFEIKESAKTAISDAYKEIIDEVIDTRVNLGLEHLGGLGKPKYLNGVFGNKKTYKFTEQFFNKRTGGLTDGYKELNRFVKKWKLGTDLYNIGRVGPINLQEYPLQPWKAAWNTAKDMRGKSIRKVSAEFIKKAIKYTQLNLATVADQNTFLKTKQIEIDTNQTKLRTLLDKSDKNISDVKVIGKLYNLVQDGLAEIENYQFNIVGRGNKLRIMEEEVKRLMKQGYGEEESFRAAGEYVDNLHLQSNFETLSAKYPILFDKSVKDAMENTLISPNQMAAMINSFGRLGSVFDKTAKGSTVRRTLRNRVLAGFLQLQALSFAMNGKLTFQNDDPDKQHLLQTPFKDGKGNTLYLNILGHQGKILALLNDPVQGLANKMSFGAKALLQSLGLAELYGETIPGAIRETLTPVPLFVDNVFESFKKKDLSEEGEYGIGDTNKDKQVILGSGLVGLDTYFSDGNTSKGTFGDLLKLIYDGDDISVSDLSQSIIDWVLPDDAKTKKDIVRDKAGISGDLSSGQNGMSYLNLTEEQQEELRKVYDTSEEQSKLDKWELVQRSPNQQMSYNDYKSLAVSIGMFKEGDKITKSNYNNYVDYYKKYQIQKNRNDFINLLEQKVQSGEVSYDEAREKLKKADEQVFISDEEKERLKFSTVVDTMVSKGLLTEEEGGVYIKRVVEDKELSVKQATETILKELN